MEAGNDATRLVHGRDCARDLVASEVLGFVDDDNERVGGRHTDHLHSDVSDCPRKEY